MSGPTPTHSPLPWRKDGAEVLDANGRLVATAYGGDELARRRAAFIVTACNSHVALLEALKLCQVRIFMAEGSENEAYQLARAAIALAEGRPA